MAEPGPLVWSGTVSTIASNAADRMTPPRRRTSSEDTARGEVLEQRSIGCRNGYGEATAVDGPCRPFAACRLEMHLICEGLRRFLLTRSNMLVCRGTLVAAGSRAWGSCSHVHELANAWSRNLSFGAAMGDAGAHMAARNACERLLLAPATRPRTRRYPCTVPVFPGSRIMSCWRD